MIRYRNGVVGVDVWGLPLTLRKSRARLREKALRYDAESRIKERGDEDWGPWKSTGDAVKSLYGRISDDKVGSLYYLQPKTGDTVFRVRKVEVAPPLVDTVGTPAVDKLYTDLMVRFPLIESWGICNCRKIAGSSTWSQHSWCNAWDIWGPSMSYMDQIYEYVNSRRIEYNVSHLLWRVANHFDHIHVDFSPAGTGTPPCAR